MARRITVIGAGVIGLSTAHEFAAAGDRVTIVADTETMDTVSAVSAALWFPFHSEKSAQADLLLARSLARFEALFGINAAGVRLRTGRMIERRPGVDRSWTSALTGVHEMNVDQLPQGAVAGLQVAAPFIDIPRYLPWLRERVAQAGVTFESRTIRDLRELEASSDLVVIAGGIRGGELLGGDPEVTAIRGQVVRLENPGMTEWIVDEEHPKGLVYVFPREHDVLVGGTADEGDWGLEVRPEVEHAILERARELVPRLNGLAVLGSGVGLRPARPRIRLEQVEGNGVPVIAAYGHGGSGVTLSWGTAERVVQLASDLGGL